MSASQLSRVGLSPSEDTAAAPTGNRKAVLGIAGLLTVVLALGASLVLGGGSDDLEDLGAPPAAAAAEPTAGASPSASPAQVAFPDGSTARDGRDPFAPLYVEPEPAAAVAGIEVPAPDAGAPDDAPADPAAPADLPAPAAPAAPAGSAGSGGEQPAAGTGALSIALLRTEGSDPSRTAVFSVDGAELPVAVGESFGPSASLLLLSLQQGPGAGGWTAVVQSGRGEPFDVATGSVVTVALP